jgi:hypothetical protein
MITDRAPSERRHNDHTRQMCSRQRCYLKTAHTMHTRRSGGYACGQMTIAPTNEHPMMRSLAVRLSVMGRPFSRQWAYYLLFHTL